jgi:hypothetical protein
MAQRHEVNRTYEQLPGSSLQIQLTFDDQQAKREEKTYQTFEYVRLRHVKTFKALENYRTAICDLVLRNNRKGKGRR